MVFNATFNNISVMSWQSVLLVEETGVSEKTTDFRTQGEHTSHYTTDENYHNECHAILKAWHEIMW